ncbi:MAG: hypothetical protein WC855_07270 [Thermodesulfovibrionales bacterium]
MDLLPGYEIYIDESNTPIFKTNKQRRESPYAVCAIAISILDKKRIENLLPRDETGGLMKFSSLGLTDGTVSQFLDGILESDILFSLVGLDTSAEENCQFAELLTDTANQHRRKKIKQSNLMYARVAAEAIIAIYGSNRLSFFDIIFDSNSLPKNEFNLLKNILKDKFAKRGVIIREITRKTEQQEPLLLAADIIAGVGRRWDTHQDVPQSWGKIIKGQKLGKVIIRNGIEVYNAG